MARFDEAIDYVLANEGVDSDDAADAGGRTRFGITHEVATVNGYDVTQLTIDQAKSIYHSRYWSFDNVNDQRVATKLLDIVVNCGTGGGVKIIQRAMGVKPEDGAFGQMTLAAINSADTDDVLECVSSALSDHYVDLCIAKPSQWVFLKGWERRAIRRPKVKSGTA